MVFPTAIGVKRKIPVPPFCPYSPETKTLRIFTGFPQLVEIRTFGSFGRPCFRSNAQITQPVTDRGDAARSWRRDRLTSIVSPADGDRQRPGRRLWKKPAAPLSE